MGRVGGRGELETGARYRSTRGAFENVHGTLLVLLHNQPRPQGSNSTKKRLALALSSAGRDDATWSDLDPCRTDGSRKTRDEICRKRQRARGACGLSQHLHGCCVTWWAKICEILLVSGGCKTCGRKPCNQSLPGASPTSTVVVCVPWSLLPGLRREIRFLSQVLPPVLALQQQFCTVVPVLRGEKHETRTASHG